MMITCKPMIRMRLLAGLVIGPLSAIGPSGGVAVVLGATGLGMAGLGVTVQDTLAQEAVRTRAWDHSEYGRMVFDWPRAVPYTVEIDGRVLEIRFEEALATNLATTERRLDSYIGEGVLSDDGRTIRFPLKRPIEVNDFRNGNSIVVDLRPVGGERDEGTQNRTAETAAVPRNTQQSGTQSAPLTTTVSNGTSVTTSSTSVVDVPMRAGLHEDFRRMVFDWPFRVGYAVDVNGGDVAIRFRSPASIDLSGISAPVAEVVRDAEAALEADETVVRFSIPPGASLRDFRINDRVVVDVLSGTSLAEAEPETPSQAESGPRETATTETAAPETAETGSASTAPAQTANADGDTGTESGAEEGPSVEGDQELANAFIDALARAEEEIEAGNTTGETEGVGSPPADGPNDDQSSETQAAAPQTAEPGIAQAQNGESPNADVTGDDAEGSDAGGSPIADSDDRAEVAEAPTVDDDSGNGGEAESAGDVSTGGDTRDAVSTPYATGPLMVTLAFDWPEEVGAAVYRRGDYIWVVFGQQTTVDVAGLREAGAPVADRIEQLPIGNATALRIRVTDRTINPFVRREGFTWLVDLRRAPQRPRDQVPIETAASPGLGPHLLFPNEAPGRVVAVPDPELGDVVQVATYRRPSYGVDGERTYPEFTILASAQGVALVPFADDLVLDRSFDGFQLAAPDGLFISGISPEAPVAVGKTLSAKRLFDPRKYAASNPAVLLDREQDLWRTLSEVPESQLTDARLELARFYIANDLGAEAIGVMRTVMAEDEEAARRAETVALRGMAEFLIHNDVAASEALDDRRLDGFAEIATWRAAALAERDQFAEAHELFQAGDSVLRLYPNPLRARLGLLRIETAFANRDLASAESWIEDLQENASELPRTMRTALTFNAARAAASRTDFDESDAVFQQLANGRDRKYAFKSEQILINQGLQQGDMSRDEAIERLERLRFQWRGDRSELFTLKRLGDLYLENEDYFGTLDSYRTAVTYFSGDPVAEDIAVQMTDLFRDLFLGTRSEQIEPLRAIALFEEFRELTPSGADGDAIIETLADRLVAVDLLPKAARQLDRLMTDRLPPGDERARIGAKLAFVHLLDGNAEAALQALRDSREPLLEIEPQLEADRRRIGAKAEFELGNVDQAITELAGDTSTAADLLRRDIYWQEEDWKEVSKVLQRLAGNPPEDPAEGMAPDRARYVVNWAVALYHDDDRAGMEHLRDLYAGAMANSEYEGIFRFITDPDQQAESGDVNQTVQDLIGSDQFNAFMENYRDRILSEDEGPISSLDDSLSRSRPS